jgi:hypothetical protein
MWDILQWEIGEGIVCHRAKKPVPESSFASMDRWLAGETQDVPWAAGF